MSTIELIIYSLFAAIFIHSDFNLPFRIKRLLNIRNSKTLPFIDCFPCFAFWGSLITTIILNEKWIVPASVFVIAKFYEIITINGNK